mmetsp:Transcript_12655/g.34914  ORF Transcript_12655/g.34914 Transcript_12655/m.34914 type:complete len:250 (+) Transcript_12655:1577-2326(+)
MRGSGAGTCVAREGVDGCGIHVDVGIRQGVGRGLSACGLLHSIHVHAAGEGAEVDGHAGLWSALQGALQQDAVVVRLFWDWMLLGDLVEVGFVFGISGLLLGDARSLHHLAKMREAPEEHLVVVRVPVPALRDASKAPSVGLADEGGELGVLEVGRDDADLELAWLEHPPRSAMRHPGDDICQIWPAEDGVHLGDKVGHSAWLGEWRQRVWILVEREVPVEEVWVWLEHLLHVAICASAASSAAAVAAA